MSLYEEILERKKHISVIGLGYVGLPLAVAFSKKAKVIGFDINKNKIDLYNKGVDSTKEVGDKKLNNSSVEFSYDETILKQASFHIVAVPTPINKNKSPDLKQIKLACIILGRNLIKNSIVVFESTVFPGLTEEICIPLLEKESELVCGIDFKVGYSPERINPGDKFHRLESIVKVVSGIDENSLNIIAKVYELVVDVGVFKAKSIKVAEAAKVIENAQRDINIAFMNELSIIFNKMGVDTKEVLKTASTKWNFINFSPGLVGGHCIGVDPYYLTYKAKQFGYQSQVILSGRRINDNMGKYVVEKAIKQMIQLDITVKKAKVAILGLTFKENCPDTRNTKVIDIYNELKEYGVNLLIHDPQANPKEAKLIHDINLVSLKEIREVDVIIIAVAHNEYLSLKEEDIKKMYRNSVNNKKILFDLKGILDREVYESIGYSYFRL
jgi:UDP-N-acetyl-D-galactosamine dehydrogenase